MKSTKQTIVLVFLILILFPVLSSAGLINGRINDELIQGGDVKDFQISPDGKRTVYRADQDTDGVDELYSVSLEDGPVVKLNSTLVMDGECLGYTISPDSSRVVYLADQDTNEVLELYSVPVGGGPVKKLNGQLVEKGDVSPAFTVDWNSTFQISPDGSRVVYLADQDTDEIFELYSVPIGGGPSVKLNGTLVTGGSINLGWSRFKISPDSSRVVYLVDQDTRGVHELYSVHISGGPSVKLNGPLAPGGSPREVNDFEISEDGSRVVYLADQDANAIDELYSVPIGGGPTVKLNDTLFGGIDIRVFKISPDSNRVIYKANLDSFYVTELYSVSIGGGPSVKLNGPLVAGGDVHWAAGVYFSPDSSRVVYEASQDTNNIYEIYSVPIGGGSQVKLNSPLLVDNQLWSGSVIISPDSSRVVYQASQDTEGVKELYNVSIDGGSSIKLNGLLLAGKYGFRTGHHEISPDGLRVVYIANQDTAYVPELYRVPIGGGSKVKLNNTLVAGGSVFDFQISPDSNRVIYLADQVTDQVFELFSVDIEPQGTTCFPVKSAGGKVIIICF